MPSNLVVNNFASSTLPGSLAVLGTCALGYLSYRTIEKLTRAPKTLNNVKFPELASLLERAKLSQEKNQISFEGGLKTASFQQVSDTIERLYSKDVSFMRERQKKYDSKSFSEVLAELFLICIFPFFLFCHEGPPSLNHYEEAQVRSAMKLRRRACTFLNNLQKKPLQKESLFEKLLHIWKKIIGRVDSSLKATVERDVAVLEKMVSHRKGTFPQSILKEAVNNYETGKYLSSRAGCAMAMVHASFCLADHIATMAYYSFFVYSQTCRDAVSLVAKDASADLHNLGEAALGIFSPGFVSVL